MPRSLRIGIVVISLLIIGAVSLLLYVRNRGFSAREKPSRLEEIMARNARRIATQAPAKPALVIAIGARLPAYNFT